MAAQPSGESARKRGSGGDSGRSGDTGGSGRPPRQRADRRTDQADQADQEPSPASMQPKPAAAAGVGAAEAPTQSEWEADVAGLSYLEARTALELVMAQLQSDELEVEEMAGLYRRAEAFARRCEAVLHQVEQDVIEWEADTAAPPP